MANMCTNILYCRTEHESDLKKVEDFLEENFDVYQELNEENLEAEFESRWDYPETLMNKLWDSLEHKESIYIRILSHCLEDEYACLRVFKNGEWEIK